MAGHDPLSGIEQLGDQIRLSHARDGLAGSPDKAGREVPLGQGHVNWTQYLALLAAADYTGPQILRRTDSARPAQDLAHAKSELESLVPF